MASTLTVTEVPAESAAGKMGAPILQVAGRLDTNTVSVLERALMRAMSTGAKSIVLDMSQVGYVSSSGLRVLLVARREAKERKGNVVLCALTPQVRDVFDMVGFTSLFDIRENLEQGKKAVAAIA
jgi:anti-anti-sigma factor